LDGDGVSHTADGTSTQLPIGERFESPQSLDTPIGPTRGQPLRMATGPHAALLSSAVIDSVVRQTWTVSEVSNRVGVRLVGATIAATALGQLDSLALVRGAVQLTPSGELVVMLADHPTTGGYPVVAVMLDEFVDQLAQCPAGNRVNLRLDD
jgi:allophanate hydrolase subunit 2